MSYTALTACNFRQCIPGGTEHFGKYGGITAGFHKDHIFSVRDGFDEYVAEHIISAPINLAMTKEKRNLSKGCLSSCALDELFAKYEQFEAEYPEWLERLARYEANQPTFVFD